MIVSSYLLTFDYFLVAFIPVNAYDRYIRAELFITTKTHKPISNK